MKQTRWLLVMLLSAAWSTSLGANPVAACSCFGADMLAQIVSDANSDSEHVAFYGSVVDSGDSDVIALWSADPPRPGLALLFEVSEVSAGEVGSTAVVHTPGGRPLSGDCSVGVLDGEQFVIAWRGADGHLSSGMCGIFPGVLGTASSEFEALFGPRRAPDPAIGAASLDDGATRPPDSDEPGALERYEELDGTTATPVTTTKPDSGEQSQSVATPVVQTERSRTGVWVLSGILVAAIFGAVAVRQFRRSSP